MLLLFCYINRTLTFFPLSMYSCCCSVLEVLTQIGDPLFLTAKMDGADTRGEEHAP